MSGPFGSSQWMYSSGAEFYDFPIEQALKFNDNDSSYLSWTPASAGNRKTWTWSGWVKRSSFDRASYDYPLFISRGTAFTAIAFAHSGKGANLDRRLFIYDASSGMLWNTAGVQRDTSAWYHIVVSVDTTQSTSTNRLKVYINGVQQTNGGWNTYPSQNADTAFSSTQAHHIGRDPVDTSNLFDGYLAEVNFIDGQALDASSFGEFKSGVWIPKDPSGLTYGTNGFRLSFQNDTVTEGFNTVTYRGNGVSAANGGQSINGLGFTPDMVWTKQRSSTTWHMIHDVVRGAGANKSLGTNSANAEPTNGEAHLMSFNSDGFTVGHEDSGSTNVSGGSYVAWCWDAGSGSPASNTQGSITSTVKANTDYGLSILTYSGDGTTSSVGHGLSQTPELFIIKRRDASLNWYTYTTVIDGSMDVLFLNLTDAKVNSSLTAPTSSVLNIAGNLNLSGANYVCYAFHSVANYSSIGTYTGTGANGNAINLGWKPAFVLVKKSSNTGAWSIFDANRYDADNNYHLNANTSDAEYTDMVFQFTDTGFTVGSTGGMNHSGETFVYLAIKDTRDNAFWRDQSGNGNDWQPNNLTYQDSLPDAPTNTFCTFNSAIRPYPNADVLSEGNLRRTNSATGVTGSNWGTFSITSGKWYYEAAIEAAGPLTCWIGWSNDAIKAGGGTYTSAARDNAYMYMSNGNKALDSATGTAYGATYTTGDVIGVALDADNDTITFYKNGVSQGVAFTGISTVGSWIPAISSDPGWIPVANFGQDSSFAGSKPAQGNTDDNGIGDFYYAPPSALALCTANLPDPVIDPAKDDTPSDYFNTVTYNNTGTSYPKSVTGIGFQPDLIWVKSRTQAYDHYLFDAVRGTGAKKLSSNTTAAEGSDSTSISSFDSDGYTISSGAGIGDITGVTWSWLAGNGTSSNTDGSITSTVSVNQKAGFSVVSYTGTGSNATVGHGLGAAPSVIIGKNRDNAARAWNVYHVSTGNTGVLQLNSTNAFYANSVYWQNTTPSSTVFTLGTQSEMNGPAEDHIAYCFAEVEGYSKFGSYTGNGSTDGPFVYTGFRPAFVMVKRTDAANMWLMMDDKRYTYNVMGVGLRADTSGAEFGWNPSKDFLSSGFKVRTSDGAENASGGTYIYMAFAENPFKYANAR